MEKIDYSIAYRDTKTLFALSLNVFIGDWIDNNDKKSVYYERMKKALAITNKICDGQIATTFSEHEAILKELVSCSELFCEAIAETTDYHKYLPFKSYLETLSNKER
ncbi:hypothetical protein [Vibrio coralliilyticus]|uniref:Uncharacterized protein n=1 Tax=Vibrio coralliilyticus TaxID=190893 RepID=A0AAP7DER4_9VIBR|nr:hypothetical protein [Vibrio coralliilyticus]NOI31811.1 hypothetical protein [Vibrio coralliilyticus]NOJ25254.1 hypothetical protein [Vibrio coralliilyticus]